MKRRSLITVLFTIIFSIASWAGVNRTLEEAQSLFTKAKTAAQYEAAKKKYRSAAYDPGYNSVDDDNIINNGITKCDKRIAELTPYLKVKGYSSSISLSFSENGGSEYITISTNASSWDTWGIPSWCTVSDKSSTSFRLECAPNTTSTSRNDYMKIQASNGKEVRINITQSASSQQSKLNITSTEFANTDKDNNILTNYGSTLYSSQMRYLKIRLNYNGLTSTKSETIYVKIYKPDGSMMSGNQSPDGYTFKQENSTFYSGSNSIELLGYGNNNESAYSSGSYRYEIWINNKNVFTAYAYISNDSNSEATYLKVDSKTALTKSYSSEGYTETFYVNTDGSEWTTWGVPSWCEITNKTTSSFTLKCFENTSSSSRSDYMKVKSGNKEVRIDITQEGKSESAKIEQIWVDHNHYQNGEKGMLIHVKFSTERIKYHNCRAIAYFYYENGDKLKDYDNSYHTSDGQVSSGEDFTPSYDSSIYNDLKIFLPHNQLHIGRTYGKSISLKFQIQLYNKTTQNFIATSEYIGFTYSN